MTFYNVDNVSTSFEIEGGSNYVFADGSVLLTMIDEAKWHSFDGGERFINLRFTVLAPETDANGVKVANRKLFTKLYTVDGDRQRDASKADKKKDRAIRMLLAIDANVYGKIAKLTQEPTDSDLQEALCGKPFRTRWGKWEFDGKEGNWLQAVMPADGETKVEGGSAAPQQQQKDSFDDSDIPF